MSILPAHLPEYPMKNLMPKLEEDIRSPGTGLIDGVEPLSGCWELKLHSLQEQ